mmetsp:Transcript_18469/g.30081  ORF Transcript_18469/g.30081 Transcript_18469/m.30081 type:complete len:231 (-) Transcript_18469:512-1204(-)
MKSGNASTSCTANLITSSGFRNHQQKKTAWPFTLITAFPMSVAMKNVQKETLSCPQHIPTKSKAAFGQADITNTPQNPYFSTKSIIHAFILLKTSSPCASPSASLTSSSSLPARAAARLTAYGGISPAAVPAPHKKAGITTNNTTSQNGASGVPSGTTLLHSISQTLHHVSHFESKSNVGHLFDAATTLNICGNKNKIPLCIPEPNPTELRTPKPNHHRTKPQYASIGST